METVPKIVLENNDLLIIDKPVGMVTTKEKTLVENTLEDWLKNNHQNNLERNGIMHRLDKNTSGLVVVAKTQPAFDQIRKQFLKRTIEKEYLALVIGDFPFEAEINLPIGRKRGLKLGKFGVVVDGKKALTGVKLIRKYLNSEGKKVSLVRVRLYTGRTHQIRVHLSHLGWPIVGDSLYGQKNDQAFHFLHSARLALVVNEKKIEVESWPNHWQDYLKTLNEIS